MSHNYSTANQPDFAGGAYPVRADDRASSWAAWLEAQNLSITFTTYQTNGLFLLGRTAAGKPTAIDSSFDRPIAQVRFQKVFHLNAENSLEYGDAVVGWPIAHRVAADSATPNGGPRTTVEPYRSRGWSVPLLAAVLQRQIAAGIPYFTFALSAELGPMVSFFRRRIEPYLSYASESKTLCQPLNHLVGESNGNIH